MIDYFLPAKPPEPLTTKSSFDHDALADRLKSESATPPRSKTQKTKKSLRLLPILALPIGDRDVVRAAFAWNLAVEIARMGGRAKILTPELNPPSPLWPEPGMGPLGTELIPVRASNLDSLYRVALDSAFVKSSEEGQNGGIIFVRVPPAWLLKPGDGAPLLRWSLLFSTPRPPDLKEACGVSKTIFRVQPNADVGITIHGAQGRREAEGAFDQLSSATQEEIGHNLRSHGLLVDDLHVYRAIVAQRPIGLAYPQAPAARALRDIARILMEEAEGLRLG